MTSPCRVVAGLLLVGLASCAKSEAGFEPEGDSGPARDAEAPADAAQEDAGRTPDAGHDAGDGASDDAAVTDDAGDLCAATTSCLAPIMLGSVSGDQGADSLTFEGAGEAFIAVQVREDDGGVIRTPVEITATLTSPAGANFDILLYAAQDGCVSVTDSSTTMFLDIVDGSWGDEGLSNADDSRTVYFQVRHASGACDLSAPWKLEVRGNS